MNFLYHSDQAHIAEEFHFIDAHTIETARLAHYKINSYNLSLSNKAYQSSRQELKDIIDSTLLNYVTPDSVLYNERFFEYEMEN